jgi:hypothetical protein
LFTKFNKKARTVFLDPNGEEFNTQDDLNIILSPSMYWVKKLQLPVKTVREAKGLVESLFEDVLPEDATYSYYVYKDGEFFYIFAYEDKLIIDTLIQKGINSSQVRGVYFSQSELCNISGAVKINEKQSIYVENDIVVLVPCCWIEESGDLDITSIELSKHSFTLKQYSHIVDNKTLYTIIALLAIFTIISATEFFIIKSKTQNLSQLNDDVFIKASMKPTMMQNVSIVKKYKSIDKKQTKIRESISHILKLKLQNGVKIEKMKLLSDNLVIKFDGMKNGMERGVKSSLDKKKVIYNSYFKDDNWYVEFKI